MNQYSILRKTASGRFAGYFSLNLQGLIMRMLLNASFPHDLFNAAVKDGTAGQKIARILDEMKPEAVYFTEKDGYRAAVMVVELPDPSKISSFSKARRKAH
jgi:hypothetical protein